MATPGKPGRPRKSQWLPPHLVIDQDALQRLFDLHQPPDTDFPTFINFVQNLPIEDLEQLLLPWLHPGDSEGLPVNPQVLQHRALARMLTREDILELWRDFDCSLD